MNGITLLATWIGLPLIAWPSQDPHSAVMGFDQTRTTHHFLLYPLFLPRCHSPTLNHVPPGVSNLWPGYNLPKGGDA